MGNYACGSAPLARKIVERGAPATAVQVRDIMFMVCRYANERGHKHEKPGELVRPYSMAVFQPKDRSLEPEEIRLLYNYLEHVATAPTIRLAVKLLMLTMLRKSELIEAEWEGINFTNAIWTIPASRMKRHNPHNVYQNKKDWTSLSSGSCSSRKRPSGMTDAAR